jgi:hypothetical protein
MASVNDENATCNSLVVAYTNKWQQLIRAPIKYKNSCIEFENRKLNEAMLNEIKSFLMSSFHDWTENVFDLHLNSLEILQRNKNNENDQLAILYFNKTFVDWFQIETNNMIMSVCEIKEEHVRKAFDLTTSNLSLLTSFNKVLRVNIDLKFLDEK